MKYNIRGKKIEVTDAIRDYMASKIERLEKYLDDNDEVEAKAVVSTKGKEQKVEVTIWSGKYNIRAEESSEDLYAAMDLVIDKLERQVRKNKTRLMSKKVKQSYDFNFDSIVLDKDEEKEDKKIVKRKTIEVKPMNEEEAILQMELLGHQFYMYKDSETNKPAVVYKRNDSNYGIIESE